MLQGCGYDDSDKGRERCSLRHIRPFQAGIDSFERPFKSLKNVLYAMDLIDTTLDRARNIEYKYDCDADYC
eukprot:6203856-Pleurochrysis_carterae.AAC.3